MPLDDDARRELDAIRSELREELDELRRSRTAGAGDSAAATREARADLEDVLRREGYRMSRRELDELVRARDEAALEAKLEAMLDAREAARAAAEEEAEEEAEDGDGGKEKEKRKTKTGAGKKTDGGGADDDEEEEWK